MFIELKIQKTSCTFENCFNLFSMLPTFLQSLKEIIQTNLPGEQTHLEMLPKRVMASSIFKERKEYRNSAVSVLLFEENSILKSVLIERPHYKGYHSGQMAFPGGKQEAIDANSKETALREMKEEINFSDSCIHHLGELTQVYIPVSGFMVYPHVFYTQKEAVFLGDAREVASVVKFPLLDILKQENFTETSVEIQKDIHMKVPCFILSQKIVWGASALILNELKACLRLLTA